MEFKRSAFKTFTLMAPVQRTLSMKPGWKRSWERGPPSFRYERMTEMRSAAMAMEARRHKRGGGEGGGEAAPSHCSEKAVSSSPWYPEVPLLSHWTLPAGSLGRAGLCKPGLLWSNGEQRGQGRHLQGRGPCLPVAGQISQDGKLNSSPLSRPPKWV